MRNAESNTQEDGLASSAVVRGDGRHVSEITADTGRGAPRGDTPNTEPGRRTTESTPALSTGKKNVTKERVKEAMEKLKQLVGVAELTRAHVDANFDEMYDAIMRESPASAPRSDHAPRYREILKEKMLRKIAGEAATQETISELAETTARTLTFPDRTETPSSAANDESGRLLSDSAADTRPGEDADETLADIRSRLESTSSAEPLTQNGDGDGDGDGDDEEVLPMPVGGWPNHVHKAAENLRASVEGVLRNPENAAQQSRKNWELLFNSIVRPGMSELEVGDAFELFCVLFLKYRNVRLFSQTAQRRISRIHWLRGDRQNFPRAVEIGYERPTGQDRVDRGTDVVLEHQNGDMTLVQCKFRSSGKISAGHGGFLIDVMQARGRQQDLGGSRHGLWMGTDGLNARFIERGVDIKSFQHGIFKEHTDQRFLELVRDWCEATLRVQTPPSPEASMECDYEPRSAQERQLRGWRTFLTDNWNVIQSSTERSARAQMSMWCGTGKTFTAFLMIRNFIARYTAKVTNEGATVIYFVPSLWLMGQTYKSFCCQCIRNQIEHWNWVLIGSDIDRQTTQGTETAFELQLSTKIDEISDHLKNRRPDGHNIIISTYNSWNKCAGALKKVQLRPDLVIYDEAHRTAGNIALDSFKQCILDEHFPCRVRLFMTATPKDVMIGDGELGDNEFRRDIVNSMDDPERYGELIADQYTQADAADAGDIVKSKVIALMTDVISCRLR